MLYLPTFSCVYIPDPWILWVQRSPGRIGRFSSVVWCKIATSHVATELRVCVVGLVLQPSRPATGEEYQSQLESDSF